jgi:hypothetical protein
MISDIPVHAVSEASSQDHAECAIKSQLAADFAAELALYDKFVGELLETRSGRGRVLGAKILKRRD